MNPLNCTFQNCKRFQNRLKCYWEISTRTWPEIYTFVRFAANRKFLQCGWNCYSTRPWSVSTRRLPRSHTSSSFLRVSTLCQQLTVDGMSSVCCRQLIQSLADVVVVWFLSPFPSRAGCNMTICWRQSLGVTSSLPLFIDKVYASMSWAQPTKHILHQM